jgi:hypothetical protein
VLQLLERALPKATLRVIPGAGHMGTITHDAVNELIASHLP